MSFCYYVLGAPQIHSPVWLQDDDGNLAPHFIENDKVSKVNCEQFTDSVIKGTRECDDEKVQELCQSLQHHCHSFMCYKKKTRTIGENHYIEYLPQKFNKSIIGFVVCKKKVISK